MRDIATLKGYLFQTADKNWIYGISEASELVRVSYSGKIETLFADRTGLLRSLAEKEHAPIYLADGCTLFFLAGTDGYRDLSAISAEQASRCTLFFNPSQCAAVEAGTAAIQCGGRVG